MSLFCTISAFLCVFGLPLPISDIDRHQFPLPKWILAISAPQVIKNLPKNPSWHPNRLKSPNLAVRGPAAPRGPFRAFAAHFRPSGLPTVILLSSLPFSAVIPTVSAAIPLFPFRCHSAVSLPHILHHCLTHMHCDSAHRSRLSPADSSPFLPFFVFFFVFPSPSLTRIPIGQCMGTKSVPFLALVTPSQGFGKGSENLALAHGNFRSKTPVCKCPKAPSASDPKGDACAQKARKETRPNLERLPLYSFLI